MDSRGNVFCHVYCKYAAVSHTTSRSNIACLAYAERLLDSVSHVYSYTDINTAIIGYSNAAYWLQHSNAKDICFVTGVAARHNCVLV